VPQRNRQRVAHHAPGTTLREGRRAAKPRTE
jgi:hypothetical protein